MDDLPVLKKCCFCVPLRYGLLTWGYIKLGLALIVGCFYILILANAMGLIRGNELLNTIIVLIGMLLTSEIVIHTVFIIGTHKKNVKLLRIYYYYAIFMWVTIVVMSSIGAIFLTLAVWNSREPGRALTAILISSWLSICFSIVVQSFLLLSIRSEIIKLRSNCPYRFVKNDFEPEGTISSVKDEEETGNENCTNNIL